VPLHNPIHKLDFVLAEVIAGCCMLWAAHCFLAEEWAFRGLQTTPLLVLMHLLPNETAWAVLCLGIWALHSLGIGLFVLHFMPTVAYITRIIALACSTIFFAGIGVAQLNINPHSIIAMPCIGLSIRGTWTLWRIIFDVGRGDY
jgi:hypothetical protein